MVAETVSANPVNTLNFNTYNTWLYSLCTLRDLILRQLGLRNGERTHCKGSSKRIVETSTENNILISINMRFPLDPLYQR
jgi:hypothetical protein